MFLVFAALFIQPQLAPRMSLAAANAALEDSGPAVAAVVVTAPDAEKYSTSTESASESSSEMALQPAAEPNAELPEAPLPLPMVKSVTPAAFLRPANPLTVSVNELREENRRNQRTWLGLVIAEHGAATFDAWSTRHAITTAGAQELNPLLKPFAKNDSLYAAIQLAPVLMDFAARKMMYSHHSWVRRMWWAPQSASFVSSLFCGAHNLSVH
jgi:hypothetical protein